MSLLETVGEKAAVIIEIGHSYTKCGFAGDAAPKRILRSEITKNGTTQPTNVYSYSSEAQLRDNLMEFLYKVYYKTLNINSKERKVVIVESIFTQTQFRHVLTDVLFKNFQVVSVAFLPGHLAALHSLGISTALVLKCGYTDSQVCPIADNYLLTSLIDTIDFGSKMIHREIERQIREESTVRVNGTVKEFGVLKLTLDENLIENIKVKSCFVTTAERSADYLATKGVGFKFVPDCSFSLPNMDLNISGKVREFACEGLFVDYLDNRTVPHLIMEALMKSPVDLRLKLAHNIVLFGGTCMLPGFKHRLVDELNKLVESEPYRHKLAVREFKFHVAPAFDNSTAWLGAAIFGTLNEYVDAISVHNLKYKDSSSVTDWFYPKSLRE